jgi:hypothetical protein
MSKNIVWKNVGDGINAPIVYVSGVGFVTEDGYECDQSGMEYRCAEIGKYQLSDCYRLWELKYITLEEFNTLFSKVGDSDTKNNII